MNQGGKLYWKQDIKNKNHPRVFVRPFPTKEGQNLMDFQGENTLYKVVCNWDVRYSKNATFSGAQRASFLKLWDPSTK